MPPFCTVLQSTIPAPTRPLCLLDMDRAIETSKKGRGGGKGGEEDAGLKDGAGGERTRVSRGDSATEYGPQKWEVRDQEQEGKGREERGREKDQTTSLQSDPPPLPVCYRDPSQHATVTGVSADRSLSGAKLGLEVHSE